jgi:transposase
MPTSFRPYLPEQTLLLPPSLTEWLPQGHLAYFISDTIEELDLSALYERYEGDGRRNQPYDPRMMLKVLVYAYATGTFSSRRIALKLEEDVAFRVLGAENYPAHRTISEFRLQNLKEFESLFMQVVRIAREVGLVKLGTIAIDGTKIKANASKHKAMSHGRMLKEEQRLQKEIHDLAKRAHQQDVKEDGLYGAEFRGDEIPAELARRNERLARIKAARERLEARQVEEDTRAGRKPGDDEDRPAGKKGRNFKRKFGEVPDKKQDNFTDPESRIMKASHGFDQCYNAQAAVDAQSQIIVAIEVSNEASDAGRLVPMLDAVEAMAGEQPTRVLADAGYRSEANLRTLEERGIDGYVALGREGKKLSDGVGADLEATMRMKRKLATKTGTARYRRRKCLAEPPFGWIKSCLGFRKFSLRGVVKVGSEWSLMGLAMNLRRMNQQMEWA